jgi:hypothetical protein
MNSILNFTMDLWEDKVFFDEREYPAGYFAMSVMNRTKEENTELLKSAGLMLHDLSDFLHAGGREEAKQILERLRPRLLSLLDDIWRIEPFSLLDKEFEVHTIDILFDDKGFDDLIRESSHSREFFECYVLAYVRVEQAVVNFETVAWTFEKNCLHHLKQRNETFYVYATGDFFNDLERWAEYSQQYELMNIENFTISPQVRSTYAMMRHPTKDKTMLFATRLLFNQFIDFYVYDLFNGMHHGHAPFQCENCGRYFLNTTGHMTKYCDNPSPQDPTLNCRQVGAKTRQKEKNKDHPVYALYNTRCNTIRKQHERKKISDELRAAALNVVQEFREKALFDNVYTVEGYARDMELSAIYAAAQRKLSEK